MEKLKIGFVIRLTILGVILLSSCTLLAPQVRTIYVPEGDAVMLRQDVKDVDVWAKTKDRLPMAGNMTLEEGWM